MKLLVSACLLGEAVRYDGTAKTLQDLATLTKRHEIIPFCPEVAGGLPVPREPAELKGTALLILAGDEGGVYSISGRDVTENFRDGARQALELCRTHGVNAALLKERSPSCGSTQVYDGSHTGRVIPGAGLTAALLEANGIRVYSEETLDELPGR